MSKRKPYEVTAVMSSILQTHVIARSEEEAIELAQKVAENGLMEEIQTSGSLDDWQAVALPPRSRKREAVS